MKLGQVFSCKEGRFNVNADGEFYLCLVRGKVTKTIGKVKVGDFVKIDENNLTIEEIMPRKNDLIRPSVANLDNLLICVSSLPEPDFTIIDNLIIMAERNKVNPIIVITKDDLGQDKLTKRLKENYSALNIKIIVTSAKQDKTSSLTSLLENKTSAFAGSSGVGKSSLINSLIKTNIKTSELSGIGRGKNTTTSSQIYLIGNARVLDTPGFSSLTHFAKTPEEFLDLYPDIAKYKTGCRYKTCNHLDKSPDDCAVIRALEENEICRERFDRFIKGYKLLTGRAQKFHKIHKKEEKK